MARGDESSTAPDSTPRLRLQEVRKSFRVGDRSLRILDGVSFDLEAGEAVVVVGPSGSGKSTLLHLIGTLDRPDGGSIRIDGRDPWALPEQELARFRNRTIGFVFQSAHLLPQYTVLENVLLPALAFPGEDGAEERAAELVERVGLAHRKDHRPAQLSGGERQRVAVARALLNRPSLLLCDEPTGSLDRSTARSIEDLLLELHGQADSSLVVVTHSLELADRFERGLELREGRCSPR